MPKSIRKKVAKSRKRPKNNKRSLKIRKRTYDGTDEIVKPDDVTIIMPTRAQEFHELWTELFGLVFFNSLTLKINDKLVNFTSEEVGRTYTSMNGQRTLAYHFTDKETMIKVYNDHKIFFFKAADVVDFVQKK